MLEYALHYASIGWPVFPCGKDKRPLSPHGFKDATTEETVIRQWWGASPEAMIGLPTGSPSGIWAVDCDGAGLGTQEFADLCEANGGVPETLYQDTPSGGRHYLFQWSADAPVKNSTKKLGSHVDTRGEGGYIILAPSARTDGKEYAWGNADTAPGQAPDWLIQRTMGKKAAQLSPYVQKALDSEAEKVASAPEGSRNDTLNSAAFAIGTLVGGGELTADVARDTLLQAAAHSGLEQHEAELTISSGLAAGAERPRTTPALPAVQPICGITSPTSPLASIDLASCTGDKFILQPPEPYTWLLDDSLREGTLGVIAGPPGAGKGTAAVQLCVAVAAAMPWLDTWFVTRGNGPAVYLSAEDDMLTIHHRFYNALMALPEHKRMEASHNLLGISVRGMVNLCANVKGDILPSNNYDMLDKLVNYLRPRLLILDTMARFAGVEENDNPAVTAFCALLEMVIEKYGCNIVVIHHTNKNAGDCLEKTDLLDNALSQSAIRGASALSGAARWAFMLAPIGKKLARSLLGPQAEGASDGSYVAARVGMKNAGMPEKRHYLGRDENGLLQLVKPETDTHQLEEDAMFLTEEIQRRKDEDERPLSQSLFGFRVQWGAVRKKNAVAYALSSGKIATVSKGAFTYLVLPEPTTEPGDNPSVLPSGMVPCEIDLNNA